MVTQPGTPPQLLRCNDVVVALGVGGPHNDMVDDLRRTVPRRCPQSRYRGFANWLRSATTWT